MQGWGGGGAKRQAGFLPGDARSCAEVRLRAHSDKAQECECWRGAFGKITYFILDSVNGKCLLLHLRQGAEEDRKGTRIDTVHP